MLSGGDGEQGVGVTEPVGAHRFLRPPQWGEPGEIVDIRHPKVDVALGKSFEIAASTAARPAGANTPDGSVMYLVSWIGDGAAGPPLVGWLGPGLAPSPGWFVAVWTPVPDKCAWRRIRSTPTTPATASSTSVATTVEISTAAAARGVDLSPAWTVAARQHGSWGRRLPGRRPCSPQRRSAGR